MIVDSKTAADLLGITPGTLRQWVHREHITPIRGARPLRFTLDEVARVQRDRRPPEWEQRLEAARTEWLLAHPPDDV